MLEEVGRAACSELQHEFSVDQVMFIAVDVTDKVQLVSLDYDCLEVWVTNR